MDMRESSGQYYKNGCMKNTKCVIDFSKAAVM